jgi:hypothetical protein
MKRWLTPLTSTVLAFGISSAFAAPSGPPQPYSDTVNFQKYCGFQLVGVVSGKVTTNVLPNGTTLYGSPNLKIALTGPTGTTMNFVITGTQFVTPIPGTGTGVPGTENLFVKVTGLNLVSVPEVNGHPAGLFLTSGNVNWVLDSNFEEIRVFSGGGKIIDICELFAA